ncbi:hypothetical protein EQG67_19000 [Kosakonia cowanii]|nr:hypothetical protein EQG67_19000 [Kosakonia cowanii]
MPDGAALIRPTAWRCCLPREGIDCRMALRLSGLRYGDVVGRARGLIAGWRCAYPAYGSLL